MSDAWSDPSTFFRLNEELAAEVARLDRAGALDRLKELLAAAEAELWIASARPDAGLEELLGVLRPGEPGPAPPRTGLPPAPAEVASGCNCGPSDARADRAPAAVDPLPSGWDHERVLAARSRFTLRTPSGEPREVYMPDHICPACWNEAGNHIASCDRTCGACGFAW